jgi:hypothetical protein
MEKASLLSIFRGNGTVFTFKDILLSSGDTNPDLLKRRINYYVKHKELYPIRRGIYAKNGDYDRLELANKIFTPSYISFETVLANSGLIFQYYDQVFAASYLSREIVCDGRKYIFRRIKGKVLTNASGVERKANYYIASKERAFLDTIYLNKDYHFDNLSSLDWNKCSEILAIYDNAAMAGRLGSYQRLSQNVR